MHISEAFARLAAWRTVVPQHIHEDIFDFFSYCLKNNSASKAKLFQDLFVLYELKEKKKGFFVDIGPAEASGFSNTVLLEANYKWKGFWAEVPDSLNELLKKKKAPKNIEYLSLDGTGKDYELLSGLDFSTYKISIISVKNANDEIRQKIFDLLSPEGYERKFEVYSGEDDWYVRK